MSDQLVAEAAIYTTTHKANTTEEFEPAISANKLPQTNALDRMATWIR